MWRAGGGRLHPSVEAGSGQIPGDVEHHRPGRPQRGMERGLGATER